MELSSHKKIKFNRMEIAASICFIGFFISGTVLRNGIYSFSILKNHSPLIYIGLLLIYLYGINNKPQDLNGRNWGKIPICFYLLICILSVIIITYTNSWRNEFSSFISMIVPLFVLAYQFNSSKKLYNVLDLWMLFLSICAYLMLFTAVVDLVTNYAITNAIANYTQVPSLFRVAEVNRSVSYMGHPLFSSEIYLAYYLFWHVYSKLKNRKESNIHFIIALVGIALAQGRAAAILIIAAFLVFNLKWKRLRYFVLAGIIVFLGYRLNIFDAIINRLLSAIASGDISTGRNTSILLLLSSEQLRFYWFQGQTIDYEGSVTLLGMALEYPILSWAYFFGIVVAALMTILVFIYPLVIIAKRKQKDLFYTLLFIILSVNSYSGLGSIGDKTTLYCVMCCLLLNLSVVVQRCQGFQQKTNLES